MATVPWRFDYILSRFLLHRSAHSSVHALDFSTHEKIKKKTNELYRRSARFFDSTLNAFQARRKKLTVRHRLLTGKQLAWLDTVLFSCAHVPPWHSLPLCLRFYSVSKNGTCLSNCTATISCNKLSRNEMKERFRWYRITPKKYSISLLLLSHRWIRKCICVRVGTVRFYFETGQRNREILFEMESLLEMYIESACR